MNYTKCQSIRENLERKYIKVPQKNPLILSYTEKYPNVDQRFREGILVIERESQTQEGPLWGSPKLSKAH